MVVKLTRVDGNSLITIEAENRDESLEMNNFLNHEDGEVGVFYSLNTGGGDGTRKITLSRGRSEVKAQTVVEMWRELKD